MKPIRIPVVALGPGSQPAETELLGVQRFAPMEPLTRPVFPDLAPGAGGGAALRIVQELTERAASARGGREVMVDVSHLDAGEQTLLNEALGEGEVSIVVTRPATAKVQETAFAGLWRVMRFDDTGKLLEDYLELGAIPEIALDAAARATSADVSWGALPEGAMNAESLLKEIRARAREFTPGQTPHVINMSLLPVSPEDVAFVNHSLGTGPVTILSRGYGRCRITATRVRKVWLVQYFNLMDTLILNTIEITGMPEVAVAAPDDIEDTARRLEELAEWMAAAA
jgi:hydrogenase-1 operon protein HyaF